MDGCHDVVIAAESRKDYWMCLVRYSGVRVRSTQYEYRVDRYGTGQSWLMAVISRLRVSPLLVQVLQCTFLLLISKAS